jgi:hypothetical protein
VTTPTDLAATEAELRGVLDQVPFTRHSLTYARR